MADRFDLVIMGSGSTAFAAAIRAAELGKRAVMTESRILGGTCVNRGCLPSKNLIGAAKLVHDAAHPRYEGLTPASLRPDFAALVRQKREIITTYREKKYASILGGDIEIVEGPARLVDEHHVQVDGRRLQGDHILIALGSKPAAPLIEGLDGIDAWTSDLLGTDGYEAAEQPRSLVVVGGGYIGCELGQMFSRLGTKVTVLARSERLLPDFEPEIGQTVAEVFAAEHIELRARTRVTRVERAAGGVRVFYAGDGGGSVEAERLLIATGREPNTMDAGIAEAGLALDRRGAVVVDEYLRTSQPTVWAAGDVIDTQAGSRMATPVGAHDGAIAASNMFGDRLREVDHRVIPRAIFVDPEVGTVGLTEAQAKAGGIDCDCRSVSMSHVPRAQAVRDPNGAVKMVIDDASKRVLGVSMIGLSASEVIHEAAMAMRFGATIDDFVDMIHVYPTMAEALKIVALSFTKDIEKLSCCAE